MNHWGPQTELRVWVGGVLTLFQGLFPGAVQAAAESDLQKEFAMLEVDYRAIVSRADLIYQSPVEVPVEGLPLGNGRMGTLVWTTPNTVRLQINRSDVLAVNKNHRGPWMGPTDYCGGCAQVTVDVGGQPFQAGEAFQQRLSLYDAENVLQGEGVGVRCFASADADVLVLEVRDQREEPLPLRVTVSMWRAPEVRTGEHLASYDFREGTEEIRVVQKFQEQDYYCASAVAARIVGREAPVEKTSERSRTLLVPAQEGPTLILVSSAASWDPQKDVGAAAGELLQPTPAPAYESLQAPHARWWAGFWSRTFVHLTSEDGVADFMERVRNLHLYYLASTSRGVLPPKWNGSLFSVEGDDRRWGSQYWVWTTETAYFPLYAADAIDLTEPFFNMYVRQLPEAEKAARQRWGVAGAFYPETTPFDGPVVLPEEVAQEFREVYLGSRKNTQLSAQAHDLGQFDSSLAVFVRPEELAVGRYTWISHVVSSGSEVAVQAWWRYRYSGEAAWLRSHAYPLLRGTVEFYRRLVKQGEDGRYHLYGTNVHEDFWGVQDSLMDLAAIRGTAPLAIRAAEILGVDAELRTSWQELLDNLAPYPLGSDPQAQALTGSVLAEDVWAAGHRGDVDGQHNPEDVWLNPIFPFEDWTLETRDPATDRIAQKAVSLAPRQRSILNGDGCNTAIRSPIATARAGRGEELPAILASYYTAFIPLPNGMALFEGPTAHSVEHLGLLTMTLQEGLLQSLSPRPGQPEIIRVFPAWPKDWTASFRLLARGGFLVTASAHNGEVEFVEIESRGGETCQLRNPWGGPCLVTELGGATQTLEGDLLRFDTGAGKRYRVRPQGKPVPPPRRISPEPATEPAFLSLTRPDGNPLRGILGRER